MHMPRGTRTFPSVKTSSLEWVFVDRNRPVEMNELRRQFRYRADDLKEILPPLQQPKIVSRDGYLFMILLYPIYEHASREVRATEVDFFISEDRLVTVNVDGFTPIKQLFDSCISSKSPTQQVCLSGDITQLLHALLEGMTASIFPMLVHISNDLDTIEKRLFDGNEKGLIQELLRIRMNIAAIRKAIQGHHGVIEALLRAAPGYFPLHHLRDWSDELVSHMDDIWKTLEVQKETAETLHDTNRSLIDFRSNEIIKTLTIFSVLILPLTLIAGVFGMNVPEMPIVLHPLAFWILLALMASASGGMLLYFKMRKWI